MAMGSLVRVSFHLRYFHLLRHHAEDTLLGLEEQSEAALCPVDGELILVSKNKPNEAHA